MPTTDLRRATRSDVKAYLRSLRCGSATSIPTDASADVTPAPDRHGLVSTAPAQPAAGIDAARVRRRAGGGRGVRPRALSTRRRRCGGRGGRGGRRRRCAVDTRWKSSPSTTTTSTPLGAAVEGNELAGATQAGEHEPALASPRPARSGPRSRRSRSGRRRRPAAPILNPAARSALSVRFAAPVTPEPFSTVDSSPTPGRCSGRALAPRARRPQPGQRRGRLRVVEEQHTLAVAEPVGGRQRVHRERVRVRVAERAHRARADRTPSASCRA